VKVRELIEKLHAFALLDPKTWEMEVAIEGTEWNLEPTGRISVLSAREYGTDSKGYQVSAPRVVIHTDGGTLS
jgi:hypothetical protein